jgi:hypothetical protein
LLLLVSAACSVVHRCDAFAATSGFQQLVPFGFVAFAYLYPALAASVGDIFDGHGVSPVAADSGFFSSGVGALRSSSVLRGLFGFKISHPRNFSVVLSDGLTKGMMFSVQRCCQQQKGPVRLSARDPSERFSTLLTRLQSQQLAGVQCLSARY